MKKILFILYAYNIFVAAISSFASDDVVISQGDVYISAPNDIPAHRAKAAPASNR
jgi:hypothetical protein